MCSEPVQTPEQQDIAPLAVRSWAARPVLAPRVSGSLSSSLLVTANGSEGCYGGWELVYPPGNTGDYYLFRVKVRWQGVKDGFEAVSAEAKWEDPSGRMIDWAPVREWQMDGGWVTLQAVLGNLTGASSLVIKLLLRWTPTGVVEWKEPELVPTAAPQPRLLRLAAASSSRPSQGASLETNRERFVQVCRRAGNQGVHLLCLPEVILSWGLPSEGDVARHAVEVPGPHIEPFCQVAAEYGMAICFSVNEKVKELVYNTAVLINERGEVAGKYRKVHLAVPNEVWSGITPGTDFPVIEIGPARAKVGMNICMDSSAAESARAVARQGAEVLLLPIMGDHRADRWTRGQPQFDIERWQLIHRMRAMDNHLYLVAARNNGVGSGIFAPDGTTLVMDGGDRPVVWADVDLNDLKLSWTGATFKDVCWFERREPTYHVLSGSLQPVLP